MTLTRMPLTLGASPDTALMPFAATVESLLQSGIATEISGEGDAAAKPRAVTGGSPVADDGPVTHAAGTTI